MSLSSIFQSYFHTPKPTTANDVVCVSLELCLINIHTYVYKKVHVSFWTHKQIVRFCTNLQRITATIFSITLVL